MGTIGCPETSVTIYQCTLSKIVEKRISFFFFHSDGSVYLRVFGSYFYLLEASWNVMAHGEVGKWRGNWRMEWVASTLHTTSEHGVSSITTVDAHTSAASSRLNWRPRRFKWTRPFRRKTKSGFLRVCHHISKAVYPSVRLGVSTGWGCRRLPDGLVVAVCWTDSQPVRFTVESQTRTHYQTLLSTRKKKEKVRTLMAQTASDLWMSMGGNKSILRKKDFGPECSRVWYVRVNFYSFTLLLLRRLVRAGHGFITVIHRTLNK
jgi:hypothetical protein